MKHTQSSLKTETNHKTRPTNSDKLTPKDLAPAGLLEEMAAMDTLCQSLLEQMLTVLPARLSLLLRCSSSGIQEVVEVMHAAQSQTVMCGSDLQMRLRQQRHVLLLVETALRETLEQVDL